MSIASALYQLLIGPLELFFDILYSLAYRLIGNQGLAIVVLSLSMNFLVLPLYRRADALQAEQREQERRMQPWVRHIRKTFSGDERFMLLQAYYRENGYKPSHALRGSLPLLLEIPFFIAAYRFLSGLNLLQGVPFGPIRDLGAPDGLIRIGGLTVNLLPVLMTAINLVSGAVYSRGLSVKSKAQMVGLALIFLVLLYQSPAGLVFYWTLNNLFSLLKNIFYRLKNPSLVLCCLASAAGAALLGWILIHPLSGKHQIAAVFLLLLLQAPMLLYWIGRRRDPAKTPEIPESDKAIFRLGGLFLTLLTGVLIPSAVIRSSPGEFINAFAYRSPLLYVLSSLLLAAGTFLVWLGVFHALSGPKGKRAMESGVWLASGCALIDYMFFKTGQGTLSAMLRYENEFSIPLKAALLNLLVLFLAAALLYFAWKKKRALPRFALLAAVLAILCMSAVNLLQIHDKVREIRQTLPTGTEEQNQESPSIPLSREGKNVVVIMLDRAISGYVPYLFHEKSELKDLYAGFVYYPNTISFGGYTNFGAPPLYGGYEYTPTEMNRRSDELLADKSNEALKVMPVLFDENGFTVTVCDPTYAGYQWVPDLSIYQDYPSIRTFITNGRFAGDPAENAERIRRLLDRNFFCYGLFKTMPLFVQPVFYVEGMYCQSNAILEKDYQTKEGMSVAYGAELGFMNAYTVLENLPGITVFEEGDKGCFLMLANDATHEPMLLQEPEYAPADWVDNTEYDAEHAVRGDDEGRELRLGNVRQLMHYQSNMASLLTLGRWFEAMRENGVFDNTRIIIVSDHGRLLDGQLEYLSFYNGELDAMFYNALLLVKDFDSTGEPRTDDRFMTNADVPTLALEGLIRDPVNPFTGRRISSAPKEGEQYILMSEEWSIDTNNGTTFLPGNWCSVHDSIFAESNWTLNVRDPLK